MAGVGAPRAASQRGVSLRRQYTFLTVAHAADSPLLHLQARSMRLYAPPALVHEVIVVENFDEGARLAWRDSLRGEYGHMAGAVRFVPAPALARMPGSSGWWSQQVVKLVASRIVATERYVVLDAKNHLVGPLTREFVEEPVSGRARLNGYAMAGHPLEPALKRVLTYLGEPYQQHLGWFPRTSTPFTIHTSRARDLIEYVERLEGRPFAACLLDRRLTEFFLYSGFLLKGGELWRCYQFDQPGTAQLRAGCADDKGVAAFAEKVRRSRSPFVAVHRNAIPELSEAGQRRLASLWADRGLFPTPAAAAALLGAWSAWSLR